MNPNESNGSGTTQDLRLLLVEDTDDDAALILRALRQAGFSPEVTRVQTAAEYDSALTPLPDLVISDHSLPSFSSTAALTRLHELQIDVPFIVVSGSLDEESAVTILRAGAHDFITKQNLARLGPAIQRELADARNRAAQREGQRQLRETEHALRVSDEQFRQAQKMEAVGQLAGGIAHDFNNLLTAILGYSDLLADRLRNQPDVLEDLMEIRKAGERAGSLTRQLLAFSRKQVLQPRLLDVNATVADVQKMLVRLIGEDVQVRTSLATDLPAIKADPSQIEQVLLNLAINARDAMPTGGTLTLETACVTPPTGLADHATACVAIAVSDTGSGMSAEVQRHIFEPFFTTKAAGKGTGLGLAMVYGVVTQTGGAIDVVSELGSGTRFTIYLPVAAPEAPSTRDCVEDSRPLPGTETVLLVEDEPAIRELVRKVLTAYGFHVLVAADPHDARTMAVSHPDTIDLLLSDIVMPLMNGPELAQHVVRIRPNIRVLYMSGFGNRLGTALGTLSESVRILHKPFTPETLIRRIRECLGPITSRAGEAL